MKVIVEQQISNHPVFTNIVRKVIITELAIQPRYEQIYIEAYKKFIDENGVDVSKEFNTEIKNWMVTNNDFTTVRDAQGVPVPNPNYDPELPESDNNQQYLKERSFDYFFAMLTNENAPSPVKLLKSHIYFNDQIKFFD